MARTRTYLHRAMIAGIMAVGAAHLSSLYAMPGPVDGAIYAGRMSADDATPASSRRHLLESAPIFQDVRLTPFKLEHRLQDNTLCVSQFLQPEVVTKCVVEGADTRHARAPRRGAAVVDDEDPNTTSDGPTFVSRLAWQAWPARRSVVTVQNPH